ncbi:MAG TPA: hypothetical protein V6D27_00855 [Vampirovibrionales bacterium]
MTKDEILAVLKDGKIWMSNLNKEDLSLIRILIEQGEIALYTISTGRQFIARSDW